jgi:serine/threonine-protein kinase/endoribonuclease IRE1
VNQSPVRWPDGTLFLGKKVTTFYAVNIKTGKKIFQISSQQQQVSDDLLEKLSSVHLEANRNVMLIGRTDYQLVAYRLNSPPKKMSFSEFSGIPNPNILWRRGPDGSVLEVEPDLLGSRKENAISDPKQAFFSSFDGVIYSRDKLSGNLLWIQKLTCPAASMLRIIPETPGVIPFEGLPTVMSSGIELVHQVIEELETGEVPDEFGRYGHPLNVPWHPSKGKPISQKLFDEDLVNIGEFDGILYVLPQNKFPRFRDPIRPSKDENIENMDEDVVPSTGMALMKRPKPEHLFWSHHSCLPTDENWPNCLMLGPQLVYQQNPIPLLTANNREIGQVERLTDPKLILTGILGFLISVVGFLGLKLWRLVRRPAQVNEPPILPPRRYGKSGVSSVSSSGSTKSPRPPGFEEITLTSADFFYEIQDYHLNDASPRSFIVTDQVIGYGSHGTVVFKGQFDGRDVAVKRMLIDFYDVAGHEVSLLQQSDYHPNVIRYYCREQTDRFMYIVLELCPASLADIIERPEEPVIQIILPMISDKRKVLQEIMQGLEHLHANKLVHRDIKPANILISFKGRALLSDFGLSKKLTDDQSSFHATVQSGTIGWRAPECILNDEVSKMASQGNENLVRGIKITKALDIFAAGCVFYYVLSGGKHPFGTRLQREMNIVQNKVDLSDLDSQPLAKDLISRMIQRDPTKRPSATEILAHPFFWDSNKRLTFLQDVSDRIEQQDRHTYQPSKQLESRRNIIFNGSNYWNAIVDPLFWNDLQGFRKYFGNSVQDLLRAMRNKRHHFHELSSELQTLLGESAEAFLGYFESRFPQLFLQVYLVIEASPDFRAIHPFKDIYFC